MRVLFFTHEKAYGGASRALITLIDELLKHNYEIYVVVPFKNAKIVDELKLRNVKIISSFYGWWQYPTNLSFVMKTLWKIIYRFNFISYFRLVRKIKKLNIDVIHTNTSVIDIGCKVAKKLNIPHVWHFREFTSIHLKFIINSSKAYKFINDNGGQLIFISKAVSNFYKENIKNKNCHIVYDGIPKEYYYKKEYQEHKTVNFLLVGTLEENKGQMLAIEACKKLKDENINNFTLTFIGNDPTNYSEKLISKAKEYKLDSKVKYKGFTKNVLNARKKYDVELMCSPKEAFGLVTVEAMFSGNPVIGSNSGATPEIIEDGTNGYLYRLNDSNDLKNKMKKFITKPNLIKKLGLNAQKIATNKFSSKNYYDSIIEIYNNVRK